MGMSSNSLKIKVDITAQDSASSTVAAVNGGLDRTAEELQAVRTAAAGVAVDLDTGMARVTTSTKQMAAGMESMARSNTPLLQNLGRVISDMPYGIMGVANNVEALAASWSTQVAASGGAMQAIRGVIAALGGPAGLAMVGIPIVTSLAVAFGDDLVRAVSAGDSRVDALKDSIADISDYTDIDLKVSISGAEGITKMQLQLEQLDKQLEYMTLRFSKIMAVRNTQPKWYEAWGDTPLPGPNQGLANVAKVNKHKAAEADLASFDQQLAVDIERKRRSTGDSKKDAEYLVRWRGYAQDIADDFIALRDKEWQRRVLKAEQNKELTKNATTAEEEYNRVREKSLDLIGKIGSTESAAEKAFAVFENTLRELNALDAKGGFTGSEFRDAVRQNAANFLDELNQPLDDFGETLEKATSDYDKYVVAFAENERLYRERVEAIERRKGNPAYNNGVLADMREEARGDYDRNKSYLNYGLSKKIGTGDYIKQDLEKYLNSLDELYLFGALTYDEYQNRRIDATTEANKKLIALDNSTYGIMEQAVVTWSDSWAQTMTNMVWGAEASFAQILESFGMMLTQMIIQKQIVDPIVGGLASAFVGGGSEIPGFSTSYRSGLSPGQLANLDADIATATAGSSAFANGGVMTGAGPMPLRRYASGGVASNAQVAVFGEGSRPEAYVPLPDGRNIPVTMDWRGGAQASSLSSIRVEVVNQSSNQVKASSVEPRMDVEGYVVRVVLSDLASNGPIRQSVAAVAQGGV